MVDHCTYFFSSLIGCCAIEVVGSSSALSNGTAGNCSLFQIQPGTARVQLDYFFW